MRTSPTTRAREFFAPLIAVLMLALSLVVVTGSTASAVDDIYICHATGDTKAPESDEARGRQGLRSQQPVGERRRLRPRRSRATRTAWDIIPPVTGLPNGQNWTAYGREVYAAGCNIPKLDAVASVTITPATCQSGAVLVLNTPTFATWGPVTGTSTGPGSYSVTATATPGHRFDDGSDDGSKTRLFEGMLAPPLASPSVACPTTVTPTAPTDHGWLCAGRCGVDLVDDDTARTPSTTARVRLELPRRHRTAGQSRRSRATCSRRMRRPRSTCRPTTPIPATRRSR